MQRLRSALIRLRTDLDAARCDWALIGGLAVSARAEPRTTRDLDVAVSVAADSDAEGVVRFFLNHDYQVHTQMEHRESGRLATMRFRMPGASTGGVVADLLFASTGIEAEVVATAENFEVMDGVYVPVARVGHLLALKILAMDLKYPDLRPQDPNDVRELLKVADAEEIRLARHALDLMTRRGFNRDRDELIRDLRAEFEEQLKIHGAGGK